MRLGIGLILGFTGTDALSCYTCTHRENSYGRSLEGKESCKTDNNAEDLLECLDGEICNTFVENFWPPNGPQQFAVSRGCGARVDDCLVFTDPNERHIQRQACSISCDGDNCNTFDKINDIIDNQLPQVGKPVETCTTCSYETVEGLPYRGNATCQFGGGVQGQDGNDFEEKCPNHSNKGCYDTQATWIDEDGLTHKQTHRGCSAFKIEEEDCYKQIRGNGLSYAICKDTCDANDNVENCNSHPLGEIPDLQQDLTLCQVCQVAVDQNNNTLGFGDAGCWTGDAKFMEDCNADNPEVPYDMCVTELMSDWDQSGAHLYQVHRKCGRRSKDYDTCHEAESSLIEFKDCTKICNPTQNAGCNNGLQAVSMLFYKGNVQSCFQCSFYQESNGDLFGQEACAAEIDALNSNNIPTHQCPLYATGSCYTASSTHKDYNDAEGNTYIQEEFRGCTPFEQKDKCYQTSVELEGVKIDHEHCKHSCESNNCNVERHQKRRKCHVCQSIKDNSGIPQGLGSEACWNSDVLAESDEFSTECPYDHPYCLEEVTTEWFSGGQQIAIMKRGCSKTPAKATCDVGSSGTNGSRFMYQDCAKDCENDSGDNCNVNLGIEDMFSGNQDRCKTCYDIVNPDGTVSGNEACVKNPPFSESCNFYAKQGCFTAISAHIVDDKSRDDSFRGCSAFKMSGSNDNEFTCYNSQINSGNGMDTYNVCKATCSGRDCNTEYKNPLEESPASSCLVCSVTVDANNKTIGVGQDGCWEGDSEYLQACPAGQNHCTTDMEVDWMARGNMQYRVRRACTAIPVAESQPCYQGSTSIIDYKDCAISCSTNTGTANGCNTGLDAVAAKFAPDLEAGENMVGSCKTCEFFQNEDGSVTGNKACKDNMVWVDSKACPIYASHACFEASSFHRSYGQEQEFTIEDDYRGCSPFIKQTDPEAEPECGIMELNGLTHTNCKKTCLADNCNTDRLQNRQTCYSCTATRDSQGRPIGVGDDHCFDNPAAETLTDCSNGDEYCKDEMIIDWLPRGDQITRIVRGCSSYPAPGPCSEGQSSSSMFKDCYHSCWDSACNNDMSVALKFNPSGSSSNLVNTCQTCIYGENDNGDLINGSQDVCKDQEMHKRFAKSCPLYARTACFTSQAVHYNQDEDKENELVAELRKGCSAFRLDGDLKTYEIELETGESSQVSFSVAKTTCKNDDIAYLEFGCNFEYTDPIGLPPINTCQVCQVTVDQQNNTIGIGERGCWEGSSDFNQQCNIGEFCVTDLEVDWMSRGLMQYRVKRGCSTTPPNVVQECTEGNTPYIQFKDCQITCDGNINPGCNGGLDAVAYKFDAGQDRTDSCHTCVYTQSPSGEVSGFERCGESLLDNDSVGGPKIRSQSCPMYANTGCYQASSTHDDFNNPANSFVDDYRGCSTFEHPIANTKEDKLHCETTKTDGLTHVNCKSTCSGTDCNKARLVPGNSCYSCTVTLDSNFNVFGLGDRKCWFSVEEEHVTVCDEDQPYCVDELQVDWFGRGQQLSTIIRGCRKNPPASDTCAEGANSSFKYKDCQHACKNGNAEGGKNGCNNDLYSVSRKFRPDPEHPVTEGHYQSSCFACHYTERDDGKVDGNYHCYDAEAENGTIVPLIPCPLHASAACYTGSSSHDTDGGIRKNEVYKGCSSFVIESGVEANEELLPIPGGQAYFKMVKQTCLSGACNSNTLHPDDIITPDVTTSGATPTTNPGDTPPADGTTIAPPATTDAPDETTTTTTAGTRLLIATVNMIFLMLIL